MAVFALRKASRRCFLGAIAVLALAIHLFAMAASSGSSAQAIADALLIDAGTSVAFGSVPGAVSGAMDVGTTPDGRLWFRAVLAVQFARGFMNEEHARTLLSKTVQEGDGVPNGFHRGRWKVGDARREGGSGWSVQFSTMRDIVKTQVLLARQAAASTAHTRVTIPDDAHVRDFLDRCQEAGRQVLEEKIVALRTAGAGSLDLDTAQVDAVFASNCIDARIKTLQQKARLVNQQHQASQQQAVSGLQGALASAEVAITASEAERAADALSKQALEEEVARLLMRGKFLDVVSLSLLPEEMQLARSLQSSCVQKMPQTREPGLENPPSSDRE